MDAVNSVLGKSLSIYRFWFLLWLSYTYACKNTTFDRHWDLRNGFMFRVYATLKTCETPPPPPQKKKTLKIVWNLCDINKLKKKKVIVFIF